MSSCKEPRFAPHKLCKPDVGWIVIWRERDAGQYYRQRLPLGDF